MRFKISILTVVLSVAHSTTILAQETGEEKHSLCKQKIGSLMVEQFRIDAGTKYLGQTASDTILCYNPTTETIYIATADCPEGLMANFNKDSIEAGGYAYLITTLYQTDTRKVGYYFETFSLVENGEQVIYPYFSYTAKLQERFSQQQLASAPKIECSNTTYDFGDIEHGKKVKCTFTIKNCGKSDLEIYKITTGCGCTVAKADKMIIAPGEDTKIAVTFDSTNRHGKQIKTITLFTNCPLTPEYQLTISGTILNK